MLETLEELQFFYERSFSDGFCMCSFIDSIFFIGGYNNYLNGYTDVGRSCVVYDISVKNR